MFQNDNQFLKKIFTNFDKSVKEELQIKLGFSKKIIAENVIQGGQYTNIDYGIYFYFMFLLCILTT